VRETNESFLVDHEDAGVGLEVDAAGALYDLETGDRNVLFGGEPESDEVENHLERLCVCCAGIARVGGGGEAKKILVAALRCRVYADTWAGMGCHSGGIRACDCGQSGCPPTYSLS
jgi:hypothetical protein